MIYSNTLILHTYKVEAHSVKSIPKTKPPRHGKKGRVPKCVTVAGCTLAKEIRSVLLSHKVRRAIVKRVGILMF